MPAAPACAAPAKPTPRQTEGPYFKAHSPRRHSLASSRASGERLLLTGFVLTRGCRPVAGAVLDLWQADAWGAYDNAGYDLRGHELTDGQGRYWFETVVPAPYPGRTPHIHVRIQAPGGRALTTQLYLPNEPRNARDSIFDPALVLSLERVNASRRDEPPLVGRYDFVLDLP
jgi:protocatechuate 3,4-dioxygenase beta subunit